MLRPKIGRIWASGSTYSRRFPGEVKYVQGWLAEIPTYQVLNYLQYKTDITMLALAERGVLEWGDDISYSKGAAAWDNFDNSIYIALVATPDKTKAPNTNSAQWTKSAIQISRQQYDTAVAALNAHIADVTGNPHKLTPARLGTYTVQQINNLVAEYKALVDNHAQDTNNPHKTTAKDVGAVPVTGGTYTGNVTFATGQVLLDVAGNNKVVADESGVYMSSPDGQVGVDADGYGYVKTGDEEPSRIVTEITFADSKILTEGYYTSPAPVFEMDCINSININTGSGYVESNFIPVYSAKTCALQLVNNPSITQQIKGSEIITSSKAITIAFDMLSTTDRNADADNSILIGMANDAISEGVYIYVTGAELIRAERVTYSGTQQYDSLRYKLNGPINKWYRIVAAFDGSNINLFIDGKLAASTTIATVTANSGGNKFRIYMPSKSAELARTYNIRNIRFWPEALADKQISAL